MKTNSTIFTVAIIAFFSWTLQGQDIHYSKMDMVPLFLNASNTGAYLGTLRLNGAYRSQQTGLVTDGFKTPLFSIDAPLSIGFGSKDWLGVGMVIYQDESGAIDLSHGGVYGSVAYHFSLDEKRSHVLSFGFQAGYAEQRIKNLSGATFLDELDDLTLVSDDRALLSGDKQTFLDLNMGVQIHTQVSELVLVNVGLNVRHLNGASTNILESIPFSRSRMLVLHGLAELDVSPDIVIAPNLYHYRASGNQATIVAVDAAYTLTNNQDVSLIGSIGSRLGRALIFSGGVRFQSLKVVMAYDLAQSDLGDFNGANSVELSATYTFRLKRNPNIKPIIFCPRF